MTASAQTVLAPKTIEDRLDEFGARVAERLAPKFQAAGVPYPPQCVTLLGFKEERMLEVQAADADGVFHFVCAYPVLAASGGPGPKLREGDRQVPEGIYAIESLNPNSLFHLALRVGYPNESDCARAEAEGRAEPGTDIMIHGDAVSSGCLAMGDAAAEDLFVLAALTGVENVNAVLAPCDFRRREISVQAGAPAWTGELYRQLKSKLARFPSASR